MGALVFAKTHLYQTIILTEKHPQSLVLSRIYTQPDC
jgi:hypothetical protein